MAHTEIYFKDWCPYSRRALALLKRKGIHFTAYDLTHDAEALEEEMRQRSGRHTVPQIFVSGRHLGGYDDIAALDKTGELDRLIFGDAHRAA